MAFYSKIHSRNNQQNTQYYISLIDIFGSWTIITHTDFTYICMCVYVYIYIHTLFCMIKKLQFGLCTCSVSYLINREQKNTLSLSLCFSDNIISSLPGKVFLMAMNEFLILKRIYVPQETSSCSWIIDTVILSSRISWQKRICTYEYIQAFPRGMDSRRHSMTKTFSKK